MAALGRTNVELVGVACIHANNRDPPGLPPFRRQLSELSSTLYFTLVLRSTYLPAK